MSRTAAKERTTNETKISVTLDLDGTGKSDISTGIGFLDHMLEQLARHSLIDMTIKADGDLHIDAHHTTEDTGWAIGEALNEALGDRRGITRYASCFCQWMNVLAGLLWMYLAGPFLCGTLIYQQIRLAQWKLSYFGNGFRPLRWARELRFTSKTSMA